MDKVKIAEYLVEIEETMSDWDDPSSWQYEIEKLQEIIKQLADDTLNEPNATDRSLFAMLEYKARRIREYILKQNKIDN